MKRFASLPNRTCKWISGLMHRLFGQDDDLGEAVARNAEAHDILKSALLTMMESRIQAPDEAKDRTDEDRDDIC